METIEIVDVEATVSEIRPIVKVLRKKQEMAAFYFTDGETAGNKKASAIKAGYKNLQRASNSVFNDPLVKERIEELKAEHRRRYSLFKEDAELEARKNYEQAVKEKDKTGIRFWFIQWVELKGWKVSKSEVKNEHSAKALQEESLYEVAKRLNKDV